MLRTLKGPWLWVALGELPPRLPLLIGLLAPRPESMTATIKMVREKYGDAEGYLKSKTSLRDDDFVKLREIFLVLA